MSASPYVQCNPYKGLTPRCWVRLRFAAADGSIHERDLVADTGSPCAVILGQSDLGRLLRAAAAGLNTNFGPMSGGWLELDMPELGLTTQILGFGSDQVFQGVQVDDHTFSGLAGLPLLRMIEYGGNGSTFWVRKASGGP